MAEEMYVEMIVGPFSTERKQEVTDLLEDAIPDGYEHIDFIDNGNGTGKFKINVGPANFGAADMYEPQGHITELMKASLPYVLMDGGKTGVRGGIDYSWHPDYGERVRVRSRETMGNLVFEEGNFQYLGILSDAELGRAVRGFFADPGTPAAIAGWQMFDKARKPEQAKDANPPIVTDEMVIGAFVHWPLDTHSDHILADSSVWKSLESRFPKPPVDSFAFDEEEEEIPQLADTPLGTKEEVRVATNLLAGLPAIDEATHVELPEGQFDDETLEAREILKESGRVITAAGLINEELERRGLATWHTGTEQTADGELNPAIVEKVEKQIVDALGSDGLCIYLAGSVTEGFTACGPYPGTVTAKWIHNTGTEGVPIEIEITPSMDDEGEHGLAFPNRMPAITEGEFGWIVVHGGFGEALQIEGIWISPEDATKRASALSGKAVPLIGPLQFTS